ncbi:MAG: flagellar biosynthetic protein FliO [Nitrospinae bacterium]|nr:flagellar biosynthetic protein FliO [Nitrospinota bacterium]
MNWKSGWILLCVSLVLLNPLYAEAKVDLSRMNLLESIVAQSSEDELVLKLNFRKALGKFQQPVFYEKSIQMDFPQAYIQPAKRFFYTGNSQISKVYVSQFNSGKMRVRFLFGKDAHGDYDHRFHFQKKGNSLVVRIDLKEIDILDRLLARAREKIQQETKNQPEAPVQARNEEAALSTTEPVRYEIPKTDVTDSPVPKEILAGNFKRVSFKKEPEQSTDKSNPVVSARSPVNFLKSGKTSDSRPISLMSSGIRMLIMLLLVLGLVFLVSYVFKKFVLKNTMFGSGEKLIRVLGTSFLAPKKNIALVEVAGEILVLGVSDGNISLLTSIRERDRIEQIKNISGDEGNGTGWKPGANSCPGLPVKGRDWISACTAARWFVDWRSACPSWRFARLSGRLKAAL